MKSKHSYVVLIDLPEALPFTNKKLIKTPKDIIEAQKETEKTEKELLHFIMILEKNFKEEISFIGEDIIGEKFYKRFLFPKSGFMEIMYQPPVSIVTHFIEKKRAEQFALALKKTLEKYISNEKIKNILINLVEVNTEKEEVLTYEKWNKLREIRRMSEG